MLLQKRKGARSSFFLFNSIFGKKSFYATVKSHIPHPTDQKNSNFGQLGRTGAGSGREQGAD